MSGDFSLSEYFDRIEKAHLSILEEIAPIDKSITLWWGFDGLRLNEDGTLEWVNRKPKKKVDLLFSPNENANILSDNAAIRLNQLHSMMALSQQDYMRYMLSQQIENVQTQIAQGMQNMCQSSYPTCQFYPTFINHTKGH